jgi:hypothetical protein
MQNNLRINGERLCWRLDRLAQIGRIGGRYSPGVNQANLC